MSQWITHIKQLHKPADQVACLIVRNLRKDMQKARRIWLNKTTKPNGDLQQNSEALHDLRVEIRRLRVWLQQSHDQIRTKPRAREQLKQWAHGSNTGRDLEVMFGLLQQANTEIDPGLADITLPERALIQENKKLEALISQHVLALKPGTRVERNKQSSFATWLADRLSCELEKTLPLLKEDTETLHKARIHIKHMRYLIEPITSCGLDTAQTALTQLKEMQTTLGDLHDLFVLRQKLPCLLCGQLNERLSHRLQQAGVPTRGIQQDFTAIRNQLTRYLHWQSTHYEAAMRGWHSSAPQTRAQMQNALNDLIKELRYA
ncbi:MAG: CHAD domain-containing protein [Halothiobacillus sp.]